MDPARSTVGALLVGALALLLAAEFVALVWLFETAWFVATAVAFLASPLAAWPLFRGRWSARRPARLLQVLGLAVVVVFGVVFAVAEARAGLDALGERTPVGTPTSEGVVRMAAAAAAAAGLALLFAALPLRRRVVAPVAGAAAVGALLAGSAAVGGAIDPDRCDRFAFDPERWHAALDAPEPKGARSDAERMAEAVAVCGTLRGRTRAEVRALLGEPYRGGRTWAYAVGIVHDGIGPGDGQELLVRFGPDGRVRRTRLLYD